MSKPKPRLYVLIMLCRHNTNWSSNTLVPKVLEPNIILAIIWVMQQCFWVAIVYRSEFFENLEMVMKKSDFPALDVFICIADPYKEPPIRLVSMALSVIAYDYPTKKISVYVSDNGGSQLTLFACMEAAKFVSHWLPLCRKTKIIDRSLFCIKSLMVIWCWKDKCNSIE